jgi:hypothetical protein
MLTCQP